MSKTPITDPDDDMVLWQKVISQVKPLKSTIQSDETFTLFANSALSKKAQQKDFHRIYSGNGNVTKTSSLTTPDNTLLSSKQKSPVDLRQGERAGIDGGTQKRLFRGKVLVDKRIDLHGLTAANAESQLKLFLEAAAYEGCRCVLVITGKGAGVLRGLVPNWLKRPPLSPHVLALAEARPKDGGGGALYVLLRRKRNG